MGSNCCTSREEKQSFEKKLSQGSLTKLEIMNVDLNNKKDLARVLDKNEKFKYLFPFYRMDIEIFELKLKQMGGIKSNKMETEFILIGDLKQKMCTTPAWRDDWAMVASLLRLPEFKLLQMEEKEDLNGKITPNMQSEYLSKLELGILALLWCSGSQSSKASFLFNLAAPDKDLILFDDPEMKFIFVKLLRYSANLPSYYEQYKDGPPDDKRCYQVDEAQVQQIVMQDEKYTDFYYDWYVNEMFPKNDKDCTRQEFIENITGTGGPGCDFKWIFDTTKIRVRVKNNVK